MGNKISSDNRATGAVLPVGKYADHDLPLWALFVMEYLPWETRWEVQQLSKSWHRNTNTLAFYRFLCQRLALEQGVYIPMSPPVGESWRTLFKEAYKLRHLWLGSKPLEIVGTTQKESSMRSKISVFVKFRPDVKNSNRNEEIGDKEDDEKKQREHGVTLPLHQKLAMIRLSHNIKSNRKALRLLTEEGSWFSAKWAELSVEEEEVVTVQNIDEPRDENDENSPHNKSEVLESDIKKKTTTFTTFEGRSQNRRLMALKAAKRRQELAHGHVADPHSKHQQHLISKVQSLDPISGRVIMLMPDVGLREFSFNGVLSGSSSQSYAYDLCTKRLVMDLLNGFNATAIVYGQTGSGKTFSMFGRDEDSILGRDKDGKGIIPRACEELLAAVEMRQRTNGIESEVFVSYVEVFGDQVSDLLRQGARCGHSKVSAQRFVLSGAAEHRVRHMADIQEVLRVGEGQKRRAATAMNDRSTRAHSLFIVTLKQRKLPSLTAGGAGDNAQKTVTLRTRLFLADLGGSEQVKKSQVEAGQHRIVSENATAEATGSQQFSVGFEKADRMREAVNINLGLLALKKCIEALNQNMVYVPYQDSKLTMLLSEGLGGNCKTSVIVCANMDAAHASETVASLRFGERCARIETSARNNATILAGILADLDARITALEQEILQKERWEVREVRREDQLAEDGTLEKALGGQEVIKQTVVTGAEIERQQLAQLLLQRQQFTGLTANDGLFDGEDDVDATTTRQVLDAMGGGAESAAATAVEGMNNNKTRSKGPKKVLGFGRAFAEMYGFGDKFDEDADTVQENQRFASQANKDALPTVLRRAKRGLAWATGDMVQVEDQSSESFKKDVRKANKIRAKLAYSGISA